MDDPSKISLTPPPKLVLSALGFLVLSGMLLGSGAVGLICELQGIELTEVFKNFGTNSDLQMRNFMRGALLINHVLTFLLPAVLLAWLFNRHQYSLSLRLENPPNLVMLGLGIFFIMTAFPLALEAYQAERWLIEKMPALNSWTETETATENLTTGLLVMQSPWELLFNLLVMAAVPAVGEEMVFRGILQQNLERWLKKPALSIGLSALIFSLAHLQVQRFLAILLLGVVLGLLFYWTKNLWVPIAAHFFNNGIQVVVSWFNQDKISELNAGQEQEIPLTFTLVSIGLMLFIGNELRKRKILERGDFSEKF